LGFSKAIFAVKGLSTSISEEQFSAFEAFSMRFFEVIRKEFVKGWWVRPLVCGGVEDVSGFCEAPPMGPEVDFNHGMASDTSEIGEGLGQC
jgi:hypothetical protein